MEDTSALSDAQLARQLHEAEELESYDSDESIAALNEICARLQLPLEQTERGLSAEASAAVDAFLAKHLAD